jgi:hypothetical protein
MAKPDLYDLSKWAEAFRNNYSYSYPETVTVIRSLTLIVILTAGEHDLLDALIGLVDRLAT